MRRSKNKVAFVMVFCILSSCKKEVTATNSENLLLDSLKILESDIPGYLYTDLTFIDEFTGFAISNSGSIIKTTDGGKSWSDVMDIISENIYDVNFKNSNEGYAASDNGKYFKSDDGGKTWQTLQSDSNDPLKRIYFGESKSFAKSLTSEFIDLSNGNLIFTVPDSAFKFLFLDDSRCIGIGQHYEIGFLPFGDIFLTNDAWATFSQKKYNPQSEAMNITAIAKVTDGRVIMTGYGAILNNIIELTY